MEVKGHTPGVASAGRNSGCAHGRASVHAKAHVTSLETLGLWGSFLPAFMNTQIGCVCVMFKVGTVTDDPDTPNELVYSLKLFSLKLSRTGAWKDVCSLWGQLAMGPSRGAAQS